MASKDAAQIGTSLWNLVPSLEIINSSSQSGKINFSMDNEIYIAYYATISPLGWKILSFEKVYEIYNASKKI